MTVQDFLELAIDDIYNVEIWDNDAGRTLFNGPIWELKETELYDNIEYCIVGSWNAIDNGICLNVDIND